MKNRDNYDDNRMDGVIEEDLANLRSLMEKLPAPSEPHPAYWNNFLMRVHERVEEETSPRRRAWYSPALIWSTLAGVASVVAVALITGVFSGDIPEDRPILAEVPTIEQPLAPQNDYDLVPLDAEMESLVSDIEEPGEVAANHVILTSEEVEMLEAIESGDGDDLIEAFISDGEI